MEEHYGVNLRPDNILTPWAVRHTGWTLTKFNVGEDGRTGHQRLKGKEYRHHVLEFGETAMWHRQTEVEDAKMEKRFKKGIWVGKLDQTDEHLFLTPEGARKSRTVRRLAPVSYTHLTLPTILRV